MEAKTQTQPNHWKVSEQNKNLFQKKKKTTSQADVKL